MDAALLCNFQGEEASGILTNGFLASCFYKLNLLKIIGWNTFIIEQLLNT